MHRKIGTLTAEKNSAQGALDQLRVGVILTNRSGEPLFLNHAAELMMIRKQGIGILHNKLLLPSPRENELLYKLIADAEYDSQSAAIGSDMRITLQNNYEYLHCLVTPVSSEISARWMGTSGAARVAIFLSKPGCLQLTPERLAILYKLTPAEAKLAARLAAFKSVEAAASDLGVAESTVRAQLRSIFAKTGARNQSELLMLLATGTLAHCTDE